jgi:Family of unknown function (DUF6680)
MKTSDWLTIAALIIGPIAAWLLSHRMTISKEERERKMHIFRTLMQTRSVYLRLRLEHVGVLNTIPVEFDENEKVITAWNAYLFEMNSAQNDQELWRRRDARFFDLLYQISRAIGYKHDIDFLKNTTYAPSGYGDEAEDWMKVRKWLTEVAEKNKPIPIQINEEPKTAAAQQPQDRR